MALSCFTRNVFSIFLLLSFTSLSSSLYPTEKVTKELVNQLCSTSSLYTHFCVAWLTSDPATFTTDWHGLLGMIIQKTEHLGQKNLAMIKGFAKTTTDPELKFAYWSCLIDYEIAVKAMEEAKLSAGSKAYKLAADSAFKAFNSIATCEGELEGKKNVPAYVIRYNLWFERMCNIDVVFSDASLTSRDGPGLNIKVSAAMEGPTTCQDYLSNVKDDTSVLKNSDDFQSICGHCSCHLEHDLSKG
ncbi:unnamed protein product [Cochlearia groenlandica]